MEITRQTLISDILKYPKKVKQLENKNIFTVDDLLSFYPRKYNDNRKPVTPYDVEDKTYCTMVLKILGTANSSKFVKAECVEKKTNTKVMVTWFNMPYMYQEIADLYNLDVIVSGVFTKSDVWGNQFVNPQVFSTDVEGNKRIRPIYKAIRGMSQDYLEGIIDSVLEDLNDPETHPKELVEEMNLIPQEDLARLIHKPNSEEDIEKASNRIVFNTLYDFANIMVKRETDICKYSSIKPVKLDICNKVIENLPYELTEDQENTIREIINTARKSKRINALIQGDVGCGKTIVAILLMLAFCDNGYQSVLMAPTGVLAYQHYEQIKEIVEPYGIKCAFLTSSLKAKEKKAVLESIKNGETNLIIGTHSCISKDVEYNNLGLTVVDEEHKFGVKQRELLQEKADKGVHSISMSATPIPRSLAITLYSDTMDIYTIKTMPNGRKPVMTTISNDEKQIFSFMLGQIKEGHQCYVICPQITSEENISNVEDKPEPESVNKAFERFNLSFSPHNVNIAKITGKMKEEEKTKIIDDFNNNKYQILIATTIIEVGVNNPNATAIVVMDADRFGLAGLHQLRGRVGRSDLQSFCVLKSNDLENPRLNAMCETTDGFKIAEVDLSLRGTGDFIGTKQSGDNKEVELMLKYPEIYNRIKEYIKKKGLT